MLYKVDDHFRFGFEDKDFILTIATTIFNIFF